MQSEAGLALNLLGIPTDATLLVAARCSACRCRCCCLLLLLERIEVVVAAYLQKHFLQGGNSNAIARRLELTKAIVKGFKQRWELSHLVKGQHERQGGRRGLYRVESAARDVVCKEFPELLDRGMPGKGSGR